MSVLIKGLKMPNNCGACPLRLAWCRERLYMVTRPPRCPLIELPDHGELIDRDALNTIKGKTLLEAVYYAPVIIPAERSEDAQKAD